MSRRQPQTNAADPKQVAESERRAEQDRADLEWVMGDERGRRFLWTLLGQCGLYEISFTGNSETFFREGARNVGLKLQHRMIDASPKLYLQAQAEAIDAQARAKAEHEYERSERMKGEGYEH